VRGNTLNHTKEVFPPREIAFYLLKTDISVHGIGQDFKTSHPVPEDDEGTQSGGWENFVPPHAGASAADSQDVQGPRRTCLPDSAVLSWIVQFVTKHILRSNISTCVAYKVSIEHRSPGVLAADHCNIPAKRQNYTWRNLNSYLKFLKFIDPEYLQYRILK
jgi:hypothetical protein